MTIPPSESTRIMFDTQEIQSIIRIKKNIKIMNFIINILLILLLIPVIIFGISLISCICIFFQIILFIIGLIFNSLKDMKVDVFIKK